MKRVDYTPKPGWFDLSKLNLPIAKYNRYVELQELAQRYDAARDYHRQHNKAQYDRLRELCAEMQMDLILNYGALEAAGKE